MSTMNVLDAAGATVAVEKPLAPGQTTAALSRPVVIASDQSAIPVSGTVGVSGFVAVTGTFFQATQPVSLAALPALATGANVIGGVTQSGTWNVGLTGSAAVSTINGVAQAYGTGVRGATVQRVTIATDDVVPASQSGTWDITNISGTVSLPTGAATSANQSTLNTNIGSSADAVVANGVAGSIASYLRTIKDQATSTASSAVTIDQTTPGATDAVTIKSPADVISFTPTLDTAAYTAGDVLFATAAISGVTRANDLRSALMSLTAIDKSKNKPAFTLFFFQTNVTSAAANAANALSDADAVNCLGFVRVLSTDWIDLANNSFACFKGINLLLEAATGTTTVYVVGILDAGTPTFAVGDLVLKLGVVQS